MSTLKLDFLSNKILTGLWLLDYDITYDPVAIFSTFFLHKIPIELFYWKFICRQRIQGKKIDEIYTELVKLGIIDFDNFENDSAIILELIRIIDDKTPLKPISDITQKTISYLDKIINQELDLQKTVHNGQPIPDVEKGRPYINWNKCYYAHCGKSFNSGQDLIKHLEQYDCYTARFHWHHEEIVNSKNLTPEIILNKKISKCPSMLCLENSSIKTPNDVVNHFIELGIEPFWSPGTVIKPKVNPFGSFIKELSDVQIYESKECVVCLTEKSNLINLPCHHKIYCLDCSQIGKFNKCSYCTQKIEYVIPFN